MGSAVTYTYSPELQTDSGQILRIRGARLELIANVWPGTWILGWMFVSGHGSPGIIPAERVIPSGRRYLCWFWCPETSIVFADNRTTVINHVAGFKKKKKIAESDFERWKTSALISTFNGVSRTLRSNDNNTWLYCSEITFRVDCVNAAIVWTIYFDAFIVPVE